PDRSSSPSLTTTLGGGSERGGRGLPGIVLSGPLGQGWGRRPGSSVSHVEHVAHVSHEGPWLLASRGPAGAPPGPARAACRWVSVVGRRELRPWRSTWHSVARSRRW